MIPVLLLCLLLLPLPARAVDVSQVGALTPYDPTNALDLAAYCNGSDAVADDGCMGRWLSDARTQGKHLTVSQGTYVYSKGIEIFAPFHLQCQDTSATFQATNNAHDLFVLSENWGVEPAGGWRDISIAQCGFDLRGSTANFAGVISLIGGRYPIQHVTIRGNRIYDSTQPGRMYTTSDKQRQYIGVIYARQVLVEDNFLSEGGRIKLGRPGAHIHVRRNVLHNVNDNAITLADSTPGGLTHDVLIEDNLIANPIGSGVFFGADGQDAGTETTALRDVTVRGNSIMGQFKTNGITGVLPNHATQVYVYANRVHRTGPIVAGQTTGGIGLNRNNSSVLPATALTVQDNHIYSDTKNALNGTGAVFLTDNMTRPCVTRNTIRNTNTAVYLRYDVKEAVGGEDNDLGSGTVRLNEGSTVNLEGDPQTCYRDTPEAR